MVIVNEKLLSRKEASQFLGIKEQTLASWLCKKTQPLKVVKIGRLCKYRMSDLLDFLNRQTKAGCSEEFEDGFAGSK